MDSFQLLSPVQLFVTPWTAACQAYIQSLLKLMYIESVMPSNRLILCRPLLLTSIFPSIRVFSNQCISSLHQVAKALEFQLEHQSFQGMIQDWFPFRIDWLDIPAVQETLKSLLQHHRSRASILLSFLNSATLTFICNY